MSRNAHPAGPRHADVLPESHSAGVPTQVNAIDRAIWPASAERVDGVLTLGGLSVNDLVAEHGSPSLFLDEADLRARARDYAGGVRGRRRLLRGEGVPFVRPLRAGSRKKASDWTSVQAVSWRSPSRRTFRRSGSPCTATTSPPANCAGRYARASATSSWTPVPRSTSSPSSPPSSASFRRCSCASPSASRRTPTSSSRPRTKIKSSASQLRDGAAEAAVAQVIAAPSLELVGLHSHIGSQIFDTAGFEVAAHRLVGLAAAVRDRHGVEVAELNLGGGLGIAYVAGDDPELPKQIGDRLSSIVDRECAANALPRPRLSVEPGRAIVGQAGVTLYRVGTVKPVALDGGVVRTYVSVDGGMSDNIRTALYDAAYTCVLANRESRATPILARVVGKHCESGDIVVRDTWLPRRRRAGGLDRGRVHRRLLPQHGQQLQPRSPPSGDRCARGADAGPRAPRDRG